MSGYVCTKCGWCGNDPRELPRDVKQCPCCPYLVLPLPTTCTAFDAWGDWTCTLTPGHDGNHRDPSGAWWNYP